jgi:hypothetical protein
MNTFLLSCFNECIRVVVIEISPCVNAKVVRCVVEIMLTKIHHHCISIPRIIAEIVQFGLQQIQLGRTSVLEFFGHDNVGVGPRVEHQCWSLLNFALADRKQEFSLLRAESYEFSNNSTLLSGFHQSDVMTFRFAYSSCGCCKQACEYVANENLMNFRWWDKHVPPPMVLLQVGVTLRHLLPK